MKNIYHEWLKDDKDVVNKNPALIRHITSKLDLELYTAPTKDNPKGWCIAVIAVYGKGYVYRLKYDSGRTENDLEGMADDCEHYIKTAWGTNAWTREAKDAYKKEVPLWRRLFA